MNLKAELDKIRSEYVLRVKKERKADFVKMMALIEEKCKDLASKGSVELYMDADFDVDGVKIVKYEGLSSEYSAFKEHFENKGLSIQLENYGLVAILSWENENGDR